jgi:hypothetical protein
MVPFVLNLAIRYRSVVSFVQRILYTQKKIYPSNQLIGDWVGPRIGLGSFCSPFREANSDSPSSQAHSLVTIPAELSQHRTDKFFKLPFQNVGIVYFVPSK